MGRLNPQRRAALKALRARQYAERLALDLKLSHTVKSHRIGLARVDAFRPVGHPKPNAKGWEYATAPKGAIRAAGHKDKGLSQEVKPGHRFVMPSKGHKRFSRS